MSEITTEDELTALFGDPTPAARDKVRDRLVREHRDWIAATPLCLIATSDTAGTCDVSPKGDPAGSLALVVDDQTIALAERPGNRRVDGYRNIVQNPHVGLIFIIPGRGDALRVNGTARLLRTDVDPPAYVDQLVVRGHRPVLVMQVNVEQVFFHCSKAFLRSKTWDPDQWRPDRLPSRAQLAKTLERPDDQIEELEAYYGPSYEQNLY